MLVTGKTGLLGSEILGISSNFEGISSEDCDLRESFPSRFLSGKDVVIHAAAKVGGVKVNSEKVAEFFDDNVRMNMNVLQTCRQSNVKLISVLSTCVYPDEKFVRYPLTEEQLHMGSPHTSNFGYAYAKRMLDVQSRSYRQQYGCNFVTVIPNNLYGINDNFDMNDSHVIPALIRKFHEAKLKGKHEVTIWGTGKPIREFTFARDAAKIIVWIAENYDEPDPINIGCTDSVTIAEVAKIIAEEFEFDGKIVFDASKPDGQFRKPSSNKRLRQLGCNIQYTQLSQGLHETIASFKLRYPNLRGVK